MIIEKDKISEAKAKLGDQNAFIIAKDLNLADFDEKNLKACCPFHNESTASFIYNPKKLNFHCFGCSKSVDILDVFMLKGSTYIEAVQKLFELANIKYSFGEHGVKVQHNYKYPNEVICTDKTNVYHYLGLRGISPGTIDYADVREDDRKNIVFNFYDTNDVLTVVKYRPARKIDKRKDTKTWCQQGADTTPLLYNMNRVTTDAPLLVTEGEADTLSAIEAGYSNSVSVPFGAGNYEWIEYNWEWLQQFESIIICSDNDAAGIKMQKEVVYRLGSWRTRLVDIPLTITKPDGKVVPTKDLNEILYFCGKQAVMDLILSAKDTPVDSLIDFSRIKNVDLNDIDGVMTGFPDLDKSLMKLFYGTLNIMTGVNGSGKTSCISNIIAHALDQEKNTFLYSGEMPNHQTKNWIDFVLAGQRNVKQYYTPENKAVFWRVTPEAHDAIDNYYAGRLYVYKDAYDNHSDKILESMEASARKYGTKLFVLDNLTSINLNANDKNKYDKQAEFINDLIKFAVKFNVVVLLVVHPHKMDQVRRMNKMDIQGVSAVIDLAHRILSLYRVTKKDKQGSPKKNGGWYQEPIKHDIILDILKDRMMGYEGESLFLYYDKPSRRFFTNKDDLDYRFAWETSEHSGVLPYPPPQFNDEGLF